MYCVNCGKEIEDHTAVCTFCGARQSSGTVDPSGIPGEPESAASAGPEKKAKRALAMAACVLAVLAIAALLIFGIKPSPKPESSVPAPAGKARGIDNPMYDLDTLTYFPFIKEEIEWGTSYDSAKQQLSAYDLICEEGRITVTNPRTALKQDTVAYLFCFDNDQLTSAGVLFDESASIKTVRQHLLSRFGDQTYNDSGDWVWVGARATVCLSEQKPDADLVLMLGPLTE